MTVPPVEYEISLRLTRRPHGPELADFNRLRSRLIRGIVENADEGEILSMIAGRVATVREVAR